MNIFTTNWVIITLVSGQTSVVGTERDCAWIIHQCYPIQKRVEFYGYQCPKVYDIVKHRYQ